MYENLAYLLYLAPVIHKLYRRMKKLLFLLTVLAFSISSRTEAGIPIATTTTDSTDTPLPLPVMKDGVAVIKGCFVGYDAQTHVKSVSAFMNPLLKQQESFYSEVDPEGCFEFHIPTVVQTSFTFRYGDNGWGSMIITPDEVSEVYIDLRKRQGETPASGSGTTRFEGANAGLNNELMEVGSFIYGKQYFDFMKVIRDIGGMTPGEYKMYILDMVERASRELAGLPYSLRARQLTDLRLRMTAYDWLYMAGHYLESAYREKFGNLNGYQAPVFTRDYYDWIAGSIINDPAAMYTGDMESAVRYLGYVKWGVESRFVIGHTSPAVYDQLTQLVDLTPEEKEWVEYLKKEAYEYWPSGKVKAYKKYVRKTVDDLKKDKVLKGRSLLLADRLFEMSGEKGNTIREINNLLMDLTVTLQEEGVYNKEEMAARDTTGGFVYKKDKKTEEKEFPEELKTAFSQKVQPWLIMLYEQESFNKLISKMADLLGTDRGVAFDIARAQMLNKKVENGIEITPEDLAELRGGERKYLYDHLTRISDEMVARKKAREAGIGIESIFDVPQVENDKILHEIVKPHRGKVVFIDFWATWCAPCLSAMEQFKEAKKNYEDKEVVFIYLTDQTSPEARWQDMADRIGGIHYRLTDDQLNYLKGKYKFGGVPSYLLFDKNGEVIYSTTGFNRAEVVRTIDAALTE